MDAPATLRREVRRLRLAGVQYDAVINDDGSPRIIYRRETHQEGHPYLESRFKKAVWHMNAQRFPKSPKFPIYRVFQAFGFIKTVSENG